MLVRPAFEPLVGVLDHHHCGVDHGTDGDGDAAQRHNISVHPLESHDHEGEQHAQRQGQDRHQGRATVPEEQAANQRHNDEFLKQLLAEVGDRSVNQA